MYTHGHLATRTFRDAFRSVGMMSSTVAGHHLPARSLQSNQSPSARDAMLQSEAAPAAGSEAPAPVADESIGTRKGTHTE